MFAGTPPLLKKECCALLLLIKGNEPILQFSLEGWWIADLYSFLTEEPSIYNIEALENCELLLITKPSWDELLQKVPAFERYFRILIQNNLIATQKRLMSSLNETAEEKYKKLMENFPGCLQRVPQHMIASYLGITPETLSCIRGQLTRSNQNKMKVFITREIPAIGIEILEQAGVEIEQWKEKRPLTQNELIDFCMQSDALLSAGYNNIDAHFLNKCNHLKVIFHCIL